jgi:hypothetical protein
VSDATVRPTRRANVVKLDPGERCSPGLRVGVAVNLQPLCNQPSGEEHALPGNAGLQMEVVVDES